jgi:hypothetical protein
MELEQGLGEMLSFLMLLQNLPKKLCSAKTQKYR